MLMPKKRKLSRSDRAIRISLVVSLFVFPLKFAAWLYTGVKGVFSDAAESFVHAHHHDKRAKTPEPGR